MKDQVKLLFEALGECKIRIKKNLIKFHHKFIKLLKILKSFFLPYSQILMLGKTHICILEPHNSCHKTSRCMDKLCLFRPS
jgi:hypothetical protein